MSNDRFRQKFLLHRIEMCISPRMVVHLSSCLMCQPFLLECLNGKWRYCNAFMPWIHSSRVMWKTFLAPNFHEIINGIACLLVESIRGGTPVISTFKSSNNRWYPLGSITFGSSEPIPSVYVQEIIDNIHQTIPHTSPGPKPTRSSANSYEPQHSNSSDSSSSHFCHH